MAVTNHERVGKALGLVKTGLAPFVDREVHRAIKEDRSKAALLQSVADDPAIANRPVSDWDVSALLKLMWESWNHVFRWILGPAERGFVGELRGHRNRWAHQEPFSSDDAYRALDTASRLLAAVSAREAAEVDKIKMELLRVRFDEQARGERRKQANLIRVGADQTLKPWRDVVTPHLDVASGRYQQAEFAADLWQAHLGEGSEEYRDPVEFFRRTYLTESLKGMLVGAMKRVNGQGGDPVVQLQTNFGGGKTHSMLALYHLCSGLPLSELPGVEALMHDAKADELPTVKRAVLVGNRISPGNPQMKSDGTRVRTLWGELAWQIGGPAAFAHIAEDDERATSPGDSLRQILVDHGPCLILIDEWVAYARQLHEQSDLPAGSFETQFTFAQALTESVKLAGNSLLVVSLPASDTPGSARTHSDDVEVGGQRGREALDRLRNVIGRIESSWRPATAEEGFEIVRRRLFEPFADQTQFKDRDVIARAFADFYRAQHQEFPSECRDADYEKRIAAAYPIHPEVFDRLYTDWSTLVRFQRTRGVLRLMASVIHSLWEKGDLNPLIMPANLSIDDPRVLSELTRYLPDNWVPVIAKDIEGQNALPLRLDAEVPNLGKRSACRRVARVVYLGSAPSAGSAQRGIEDRRIKLGCVMPGESPAIFGDALRRLAAAATYLYEDGRQYWYDTRPTVTKLAEDRAEQLRRDEDRVTTAIEGRLREAMREAGGFARVHTAPKSAHEVPDEQVVRLVVLGIQHVYQRGTPSPAQTEAANILQSAGKKPRLYRNSIVFLAADQTRLQDLDQAVRRHMAWDSILEEREELDLSVQQVRQAEIQRRAAQESVISRLPETFQWLLTPIQEKPVDSVSWESARLTGQGSLAERASLRLKNDELLVARLAGSRLRMELDRVPLWRGDNVAVQQLVEHFASYIYLPRLQHPSLILRAIEDGTALLTWADDSFAYADSFDEDTSRYRGLRAGETVSLSDAAGLLVKPDVAQRQIQADCESTPKPPSGTPNGPIQTHEVGAGTATQEDSTLPLPDPQPTRFHGTVALDATRTGLDASRVADEVIAHLSGLLGASVTVTLEIEAAVPNGVPQHVVRTVTENSRTLKFNTQGFERE